MRTLFFVFALALCAQTTFAQQPDASGIGILGGKDSPKRKFYAAPHWEHWRAIAGTIDSIRIAYPKGNYEIIPSSANHDLSPSNDSLSIRLADDYGLVFTMTIWFDATNRDYRGIFELSQYGKRLDGGNLWYDYTPLLEWRPNGTSYFGSMRLDESGKLTPPLVGPVFYVGRGE